MKRLVYFSAIFMVSSIAILLLTFEHYNKLDLKCRGGVESHINANKLIANVGMHFEQGKGILTIAGTFQENADAVKNIKLASVFDYNIYGKLMYLKLVQQYSSISSADVNKKIHYLLPMVFSSRDIEYAYEIQVQPGGDYLIKQHGLPILYCKKN